MNDFREVRWGEGHLSQTSMQAELECKSESLVQHSGSDKVPRPQL